MLGERVGNYVITQKLGEGGMGEVYMAQHPQIGKRVALKVLHAELAANEEIVARFFHEAKAVNDIAHPNIVDIVDFGTVTTDKGPIVYLVMEFLSGETLSGLLRKSPQLDERRAVHITHQIADALAASHERGIVHRDLKPDNVMLVSSGRERDFVKLLDFGIAKVAGNMSKTRTGMVIGTPSYMSPEQCEGRSTIDHRTDIYALGIVLFEMLTGRVPFIGGGYGELLVKHIMEAPPPPSSLRPDITPHLEAVILRALMKRPDDRFATMRELANALGDPQHYVDSHGGLGGFLPAEPAPKQPTAPGQALARGTFVPANPSTTLSQSAGQLRTTGGVEAPRSSKAPILIGLGVAAAGVAVAIGVVMSKGGDATTAEGPAASDGPAAAASALAPGPGAGSAAAARAPAPGPGSAAAPAPGSAAVPAPVPATVKLTFETKPAKAEIFLVGESASRCTSPCSFQLPRKDGETTIAIKLSGYQTETRTVTLKADQVFDVSLAKKSSSHSRPRPAADKPDKPRPVGDNTLNPFE